MYEEDQMSKSGVDFNSLRLLIATVNQIECFDRYQKLDILLATLFFSHYNLFVGNNTRNFRKKWLNYPRN